MLEKLTRSIAWRNPLSKSGQAVPGHLLQEALQVLVTFRRLFEELAPERVLVVQGVRWTDSRLFRDEVPLLRRSQLARAQIHRAVRRPQKPWVGIPHRARDGKGPIRLGET